MSIDSIIRTIAGEEKLPAKAVRGALVDEDTTRRTVDIVERVADGREIEAEEEEVLCILLLVVAQRRDTALYRPLLRMLAGDRERVEELLEDLVTTTLPAILISVFDGTRQPLLDLMNDETADDFCRHAAFSAWNHHAVIETWPREESEAYLRWAFAELKPRKGSFVWDAWVNAVILLGFDTLLVEAEQVVREGWFESLEPMPGMPPLMVWEEIQKEYQAARELTDRQSLLDKYQLGPFEDTLEELSG